MPDPQPTPAAAVRIVVPDDVKLVGHTITFPAGHPISIDQVGEPAGGFIPLTITIPVLAVHVTVEGAPAVNRQDREQAVTALLNRTTDPQP